MSNKFCVNFLSGTAAEKRSETIPGYHRGPKKNTYFIGLKTSM